PSLLAATAAVERRPPHDRITFLPAAAAAATEAAATAAGASRPTTAARRRRLGLLDLQPATLVVTTVEAVDRLLGRFHGRHLDEAEAPRAAGVTIGHHGCRRHFTNLGEKVAKLVVGGGEGEATDEEFLSHERVSFKTFR